MLHYLVAYDEQDSEAKSEYKNDANLNDFFRFGNDELYSELDSFTTFKVVSVCFDFKTVKEKLFAEIATLDDFELLNCRLMIDDEKELAEASLLCYDGRIFSNKGLLVLNLDYES